MRLQPVELGGGNGPDIEAVDVIGVAQLLDELYGFLEGAECAHQCQDLAQPGTLSTGTEAQLLIQRGLPMMATATQVISSFQVDAAEQAVDLCGACTLVNRLLAAATGHALWGIAGRTQTG